MASGETFKHFNYSLKFFNMFIFEWDENPPYPVITGFELINSS